MENFVYELKKKYIIWNLKKWVIKNKRYYFKELINLDFENKIYYFAEDSKFSYYQKNIAINTEKKITIKDIEKEIKSTNLEKNILIWYDIENIKINWKEKKILLWESGEIEFSLCMYTLSKKEYNQIMKNFSNNTNIQIYPNSLFLLKEVNKDIKNGNILYFGGKNTEIINIKNSFYYGIEKIEIGTNQFLNKINEIFWKKISNINELSSFHEKVYNKELENFLLPIKFFLKENIKWETIFTIWDFKYLPNLLSSLSKSLNTHIIPININWKKFKTIEEANLYCIKKYF